MFFQHAGQKCAQWCYPIMSTQFHSIWRTVISDECKATYRWFSTRLRSYHRLALNRKNQKTYLSRTYWFSAIYQIGALISLYQMQDTVWVPMRHSNQRMNLSIKREPVDCWCHLQWWGHRHDMGINSTCPANVYWFIRLNCTVFSNCWIRNDCSKMTNVRVDIVKVSNECFSWPCSCINVVTLRKALKRWSTLFSYETVTRILYIFSRRASVYHGINHYRNIYRSICQHLILYPSRDYEHTCH